MLFANFLEKKARFLLTIFFCFYRHHDISSGVSAKTGHHQLDGFAGPFAERTTDAHAQLAAGRSVRPGKMAVRSKGQSGNRQRNDGLDQSVEILQASAADRMLENGRRQFDGHRRQDRYFGSLSLSLQKKKNFFLVHQSYMPIKEYRNPVAILRY